MTERHWRIAVDGRCLNAPHLRGMGKSLFELVRRSAARGAVEWRLLADRPDLPMQVPAGPGVQASVFGMPGYRLHSWEQAALPAAARRMRADLLHAPATSMPWWQPVPTVVTVHDTIPWREDDPAWPAGFYRDRLLPAAYRRARAVMTVSECSRRDILARWPALAPRLHVVSPGVDERYLDAAPDDEPIAVGGRLAREPYVLYLGGADPRKRLAWALRVWQETAETGTSLVACGVDPGEHARVRALVPGDLQARLVLAPFIAEEDMPRLYMRAAAVLYPSLYEGFGLPVIEAHAVGSLVLFSAVGSLAELRGPAAVVLPADDMGAWVRALGEILRARVPGPRADAPARAWARRYSWDAYVTRTLAVYDSVAAPAGAPAGAPASASRARPRVSS